jgi:predicted metal-binding membrane protein
VSGVAATDIATDISEEDVMTVATAAVRRARRDPAATVVWAVTAACWALIVGLLVVGGINVADHDSVFGGVAEGEFPGPAQLAAFGGVWLVMIGAMMLPTTIPMARMFTVVSARQDRPAPARAAFFGAYLAVWLTFAYVALAGDLGIHELVDHWHWLHHREGLILAGALGLAGAFQFSPLKQRCLTLCRDPAGFLFARYRSGPGGAWAVGVRHALSCVGCCWALMLVMFATGVGSLAWMLGLTAVMVAEKTTRWGRRLVAPLGIGLLLAAAALAAVALVASAPH